jgi:hypothetical protein
MHMAGREQTDTIPAHAVLPRLEPDGPTTRSGKCVFHARVEGFFGYFSDQDIKRRESDHRQHQRGKQRDEAKQEVEGDNANEGS